jgi:ketosteroid isomerase-like protein
MSQPPADVISGLYAAFGRGDIPAILATIDEDIDWRVPQNLPHGGHFSGREAVGRFFQGIGEHWENLQVDLEDVVSSGDRVIALARIHGRLRATGEETGYSSAHSWIVRNGTPARFVEYVDAPLTLPAAHAVTS